MNNPSHAGEHDLENDAIVAIENTVGFTGAFNFLPITGGTMSGAVAMGANKITGLANGSASSDAAAYGQLPSVAGLAPIASPTFTGTTTAPEFSASGLTGATAASRYCGSTASGHPTSGTFAVGDFIVDQTGSLWVCTVAGTPGTWAQTGTAGGITALTGDVTASASSNATTIKSSVGLTGAPTAPTAAPGTNTTQLASTAFVRAATGLYLPLTGGTMSGAIAMGANKITGLANGTAAQDAAAFGQIPVTPPGTILATAVYAPGSLTTYTLTGTLAALDTTNATLAFTVPASGIVDVEVQAFAVCTRTTTANAIYIGLLNHTGGAQIGLTAELTNNQVASTIEISSTIKFHLTGLSPGALQVDLAGAYIVATGSAGSIVARGTTGANASVPLVMQAKASV